MEGATVAEYVNVREQAEKLGLRLTSELALLPRGFGANAAGSELAHEADAATIGKLLRAAGLDAQLLQPRDQRLPSVVQRSADWVSPIIFVGSLLLSQNPYAIEIALHVISSYVADALKARGSASTVKLTLISEETKSKRCRRVDYEGPPCNLQDLAELLKALQNDSR